MRAYDLIWRHLRCLERFFRMRLPSVRLVGHCWLLLNARDKARRSCGCPTTIADCQAQSGVRHLRCFGRVFFRTRLPLARLGGHRWLLLNARGQGRCSCGCSIKTWIWFTVKFKFFEVAVFVKFMSNLCYLEFDWMSSLNSLSLLCLLDSFCFYNYLYLKKIYNKKKYWFISCLPSF
jgi:hypothetical protein